MGFFWLLLGVRDGGEPPWILLDWCVFSPFFSIDHHFGCGVSKRWWFSENLC